ncbi:MAG: HU family DNA-binding protein [Candidatus Moranbacteria bacterium]|nr:HU family DNA-binding protein [Candidatus Moranbacteria bacterium]
MSREKIKAAPKSAEKPAAKAKVKFPEKFTAQTIINYVSEKHEIPKAKAKEMIEDLFDVINAGVMKGERVPMGKFGKVYVKVRPATKARMGRNPITGEEMKIAAKKATKVPKFTFSKAYKEAALAAKIKK